MLSPLDVAVHLDNGKTYRTRWTNHVYRWKDEFTFTVPGKPRNIVLDPDNRILDVNLMNNYSGLPLHRLHFNWPGMTYHPGMPTPWDGTRCYGTTKRTDSSRESRW